MWNNYRLNTLYCNHCFNLFSSSAVSPESVCAGRRRGLGGAEERVQGSGHAAGGASWPTHPSHAQHRWGKKNLMTQKWCTCWPIRDADVDCSRSTCCSAHRTRMRTCLWRPVSSGLRWLSSPSVRMPSLDTLHSKWLFSFLGSAFASDVNHTTWREMQKTRKNQFYAFCEPKSWITRVKLLFNWIGTFTYSLIFFNLNLSQSRKGTNCSRLV